MNILKDYFDLENTINIEKYRIRQLKHWAFKKKITDLSKMSDLPKNFRENLKIEFHVLNLDSYSSSQDNVKYVFKTRDNNFVESVLIKEKDHFTLCISTQIGCAVGCKFCVSGIDGLVRNLNFDEIVDQYFYISEKNNIFIRNIVFMGMGEPLANFENLKKACLILVREFGLSKRHITISTSAYTNYIKKLKNDEFMRTFNLAISLNASNDTRRKELMPNVIGSLQELIAEIKTFPLEPRRRITLEYVLIKDINDSLEDAKHLYVLLKSIKHKVKLNLIPYNENPFISFKRPKEHTMYSFQNMLLEKGISCTIRWSKGIDNFAACGHLSYNRILDKVLY